ncbi:CDP-diacylglycerol--serine O-phosphatidyltransferase [Candidatus Woesearchaeota archaeon]|jgi:CDP-diacylglycerol--serine O-phosphatidyltransferase|nr:CDP-diacylglycerol--serine O-phosphatidyltransferase [Candidatus Woesearchaeota archaeon]|tara:strand:- start:3022 stop:3513 length:492 start_codon:yes stop_codon:yes gene_type:complete
MKKQLANFLTLMNLTAGFLTIVFSINKNFSVAAIILLIAVFLDYLDGKVARMLNVESYMGAELDSLADLVSFGVAPAVFLYSNLQTDFLALFLVFYLIAGAYRLARFNAMRKKVKGFIGMPITINGLIFPVMYFASAPAGIYYVAVIASSIFMISTIRFKKVI